MKLLNTARGIAAALDARTKAACQRAYKDHWLTMTGPLTIGLLTRARNPNKPREFDPTPMAADRANTIEIRMSRRRGVRTSTRDVNNEHTKGVRAPNRPTDKNDANIDKLENKSESQPTRTPNNQHLIENNSNRAPAPTEKHNVSTNQNHLPSEEI